MAKHSYHGDHGRFEKVGFDKPAKIGNVALDYIGAIRGSMHHIKRLSRQDYDNDHTAAEIWLRSSPERRLEIETSLRAKATAEFERWSIKSRWDGHVRVQRPIVPKVRWQGACQCCGSLFARIRPSRKRLYCSKSCATKSQSRWERADDQAAQ